MAPPTEKIRLPSVLYSVEILNGEMDAIASSITVTKAHITDLNAQLIEQTNLLVSQQNQLMTIYIQTMGSFPPSA